MLGSMSLVTAQISFLPILRLLFGEDHTKAATEVRWTNRHEFLNLSITPVECSIICSRDLANRFFMPLVQTFNDLGGFDKSTSRRMVQVSQEDYIVVQVDGQGLDAGQRVLELTSPLAMAGISIFFITTYFSDYILVPSRARRTVVKALEQRGFVFSKSADAFVSRLSPSSPTIGFDAWQGSAPSSTETPPPSTPPAKDIPELQKRTFDRLRKSNIKPAFDETLRLINCAGSREIDPSRDKQLADDILQVLWSTCPGPGFQQRPSQSAAIGLGLDQGDDSPPNPDFSARFLSLTLTSTEPISVILEASLTERLTTSLLGAKAPDDVLIPITLDLRDLPVQATGIVCGVAGRLAQGTRTLDRSGHERQVEEEDRETHLPASEESSPIEISFLSTARAGTVIVKASELNRAVKALEEMSDVVWE